MAFSIVAYQEVIQSAFGSDVSFIALVKDRRAALLRQGRDSSLKAALDSIMLDVAQIAGTLADDLRG